ncbi:MAG: undecaprenyl/decaprenyl-phosphate alpha-N-acetylglucosaminyl 1-phosphate transferase [Chitinophagales bacterium]|nr:undecaprenyl/decaprenyl-phosphate alpha-N-acetylglucosaminyl 1-phosphate transferase [Chitinophagales bacterium]
MNLNGESFFFYAACACFFALAIIFSALTNGLLLKFSRTLGDRNEQHRHVIRWTSQVKPSVGGFSFYILFLISLSLYGLFNFSGNQYLNEHLLGLVFSVTLGFLIGLADDAYNTYPWLKFSGQLLCGLFLVITNTMIQATGIYLLDVLITLIWVVGIMNSINMLDNMDGICATISLGILFSCLLALMIGSNLYSFYTVLLLGVSGALAGFLVFNWHPANIYMGDTGSQFLGAFISAVSIQLLWTYHDVNGPAFQFRQFLIPLIAFTVPLIDTTTVFIRRIARGQSPFVGGRDHISHHFAYAGLSDRQVIYLLGGVSFLSALLTAILIRFNQDSSSLLTVLFYGYFLTLFVIVQHYYNVGKRKEKQRHNATTASSSSVPVLH